MNIRCAIFIGVVSVASLLGAAEPTIELSGVMTTGGKTLLALTNTATKATTWVQPGDQFNGYTVARYDASEDAVYLKKGGQETRLGLVPSKTPEAARLTPLGASVNVTAAPADATAIANAIRANLRQLVATARQYQLERGATSVAFSDLVGPDKLIKELKPIAGENYSTLSFGPNVTAVSVTTANGATVALDIPPASSSVPTAVTITAQSTSSANAITPASSSAATSAASAASPVASAITAPLPGSTTPVASSPTPYTAIPATPAAPDSIEPTGRQSASPYTIQGGDTWQKISESTGVSVPRLKELNPTIPEGSQLPSGQTIRVH